MADQKATASTPQTDQEVWDSYNGDHYKNFGSLSLGLTDQWKRKPGGQAIESAYVGHVDGKADVFMANAPGVRLDYAWCPVKDGEDLDRKRGRGFDFVTRAKFVKNPNLWAWTGTAPDARIRRGESEELMYRSEERWRQSVAEIAASLERNFHEEAAEDLAVSAQEGGVAAYDNAGTRLTPTRRPSVGA